MEVILSGGTGLVGSQLLDMLLNDDKVSRLHVMGRRSCGVTHEKLVEHKVDLGVLESRPPEMMPAAIINCLGTTIKQAGSQEAFIAVDKDLVLAYAKAYPACPKFITVSAMGADAGSSIFYSKVKGEVEDALRGLGFYALHIARPSLLTGPRKEFRFGERVSQVVMKIFTPLMVGGLRKYRPIEAVDVARALQVMLHDERKGTFVHLSDELQSLAKGAQS